VTALETRAVVGLTSDPISNVLIDSLMERGLVRDIGIWTDEEAERCRLVAFDIAQRNAPMHNDGMLRSNDRTVRNWWREFGDRWFSVERFFSPFDPPDFGLETPWHETHDGVWRSRVGSFARAAP